MYRLRRLLVPILALAALPAVGLPVSSPPDTPGGIIQSRLVEAGLVASGNDNANLISGTTTVLTTPPNVKPSVISATVTNRMSILYATDLSVARILGGSLQMRGLPWLFRQEPSNSGPGAHLGANNSQRMTKLNGANLAKMDTADQMYQALKRGVDRTCVTPAGINTCPAHLLAVDEIGAVFGRVEGTSSPSPGHLLDVAMGYLAGTPSPWGGSYASRIHFYLAPGVSTAIAAGRGPAHNRGRDGQVRWPNYSAAIGALARAGGVWLEMYHYPTPGSARTPFTSTEWRTVPTAVAAFMAERLTAKGIRGTDPLNSLHFVMTETAGNDLVGGGICLVERVAGGFQEHANRVGKLTMSFTFPACGRSANVCISSRAKTNERHSEMAIGVPTPAMNRIINDADNQISPLDSVVVEEFPVQQVRPSGMACQWQRAQTGDVNMRILMNGPAAFRATGTEATVFGQLFRQFFVVA